MLRDPRLRTLSWQVSRQLQLQLQRVFVVEQRWWRLQLGRTQIQIQIQIQNILVTQEAPVGRWENAFATTTTRAPTPQPSGGAQGLCSAPATIFVCVCVCVCVCLGVFGCQCFGARRGERTRTRARAHSGRARKITKIYSSRERAHKRKVKTQCACVFGRVCDSVLSARVLTRTECAASPHFERHSRPTWMH